MLPILHNLVGGSHNDEAREEKTVLALNQLSELAQVWYRSLYFLFCRVAAALCYVGVLHTRCGCYRSDKRIPRLEVV